MMDNLTQEIQGTANSAAAQSGEGVAADLGKFKDVQALLNAYNNLEAEFTRRSQRLKELEERSKPSAPAGAASETAVSAGVSDDELYGSVTENAAVKDRIISDYLKTVASGKGAPYVTGGVPTRAPKDRPASIRQAGRLAAEFFKGGAK